MKKNNDNVKVTVWCLAYNHEKYIRTALEGFVNQKTNFAYEVIIHDDASTDKTAEIIREYEEKFPQIIKPIYQTQNQYQLGVLKSLNFLLPNLKGCYVAFCEGDDYWCDENKLQVCYDCLEADDKLAICVHKTQCLNDDGTLINQTIPPGDVCDRDRIFKPEDFADWIWKSRITYPFHTSSFLVRREVLEAQFYRKLAEKRLLNGDEVILRSAMIHGNIYYVDKIMSCRRLWTINNYNNRFKKKSDEEKLKFWLKTLDGDLLFNEMSEKRFDDRIVTYVYRRLLSMARTYDVERIITYLNELSKTHPLPSTASWKIKFAYWMFRAFPYAYRGIFGKSKN
ncbi:MAG: glycosyltransferase [Thermoguttaceae bacterium]|nr:glycosyltransferase [Thermoguttaceae bacterium]